MAESTLAGTTTKTLRRIDRLDLTAAHDKPVSAHYRADDAGTSKAKHAHSPFHTEL